MKIIKRIIDDERTRKSFTFGIKSKDQKLMNRQLFIGKYNFWIIFSDDHHTDFGVKDQL